MSRWSATRCLEPRSLPAVYRGIDASTDEAMGMNYRMGYHGYLLCIADYADSTTDHGYVTISRMIDRILALCGLQFYQSSDIEGLSSTDCSDRYDMGTRPMNLGLILSFHMAQKVYVVLVLY